MRTGPAKKLTLNGKVTTFKGGQVQVFRKAAGGGFKLFKKSTASPKTGAFSRPLAYIGFEKTCFQVVVPETKKYLKTVKFLGCFIKPVQETPRPRRISEQPNALRRVSASGRAFAASDAHPVDRDWVQQAGADRWGIRAVAAPYKSPATLPT